MSADTLDPNRWGMVLGLLSTDIVVPWISDMGLRLPDDGAFVRGLRELITRFREASAVSPGDVPPFANTVFDHLTQRYGQAFSEHLRTWGDQVFQLGGASSAQAFLWQNLLTRGGLDGSRDTAPPPPFVRAFRHALAALGPRPRVGHLPSTEWDIEIYRRAGYDEDFEPMVLVDNTIGYVRFLTAWHEALAEIGAPLDRAALRTWALGEAALLGMPEDIVEEPGPFPTWSLTKGAR